MPIHFRCTTCNKLLSIARRKAGQGIDCPVCGGSVRVPEEIPSQTQSIAPEMSPISPPAGPIFSNATPPAPSLPINEVTPVQEIFLPKADSPASAFMESPVPVNPKPAMPFPKKNQTPTSSILELDPDTFFGSAPISKSGPATTSPQPGILDEMDAEIPKFPFQGNDVSAEDFPTTELVGESVTKSSWKLILFGTFLILGMVVAAFLAWKLVFSTPS